MSVDGWLGPWEFAGRTREIGAIDAALAQGRHVVLLGQAGSGKTRLGTEVVARLAADGVTTRRITGSPSATPIPLAALSGLLDGDISGDVVARALRALDADGRSGAGDPVLLVDDAHSLDDASAVAVHQLALSGKARLVLTVRSGNRQPEALTRLFAESSVAVVDVPPLDDTTIAALLEQALAGPVDTRTLEVLVGISQGNPLYVRELVIGSIDAGVLARREGLWRFTGDVRVTPQLAEVVMARLSTLPPTQRDAMELLAVGGSLELDLATRLVSIDDLDALERAGLVAARIDGDRQVLDVGHPLHRELLRLHLGPLARLRVLRTLAETDSASTGPRSAHDELRSVVWRVRGGLPVEPDRLLHAAKAAMAAFDTPLGAELAELAYRTNGDRDAALIAAWCLAEHGRADLAIELTREGVVRADDDLTEAAFRQRVSEYEWWFRQDLPAALAILDVGLADREAQALLDAQRAVYHLLDGELDEALTVSAAFLSDQPLYVRFVATIAQAQGLVYSDHPDDGAALAAAFFDEALRSPDELLATDPGVHVVPQVLGMLHAGRFQEAADTAAFVSQIAASQQGTQSRGFAAIVSGFVELLAGRPANARRLLREAEGHWSFVNIRGIARWATSGQVLALCQMGDVADAASVVERATGYPSDGFRLYEPFAHLGRAWIAVLDSDLRTAREEADAAIGRAADQGAVGHLSVIAHDLARLGLHAEATAAVALIPAERTAVVELRCRSVAALVEDDIGDLEECADGWTALGAPLFAAELLTVSAARHRKAGRAKDHQRCDGAAGLLLASCGTVSTPLLAARASTGVLSRRESEIAELAARGLSNREIADRLIIGERTVESHLYRVFTKLAITSRDQIAGTLPVSDR